MNSKFMSMLAAFGLTVAGATAWGHHEGTLAVGAAERSAIGNEAAVPAAAATEDLWGFLPEVVAKTKAGDVTKQEFIDFIMPQLQGPDGKISPMITSDMLQRNAAQAIKDYIDMKLLSAEAEKAGFKPSEELVREQFKKALAEMPEEQREQMKMIFLMSGKNEEDYIGDMARNPVMQKNVAIQKYLEETIVSKVTVSDAEVKAYYDANPEMMKEPADAAETVRASHILLAIDENASEADRKAAREKMEKILAEIKKDPAAFEKYVEEISDCPSKSNKGSLGAFPRGQMVKPFEDAVFALQEGALSEVVETQFGFHIIRRDPSQPERVIPFEEARERLADMLKNEKVGKAFEELQTKLHQDNDVEILVKPAEAPVPALQAQ